LISVLLLYVALGVAGSVIFFLRFPDAVNYPNFYAEDGIYVQNIIDKGIFGAMFESFNGYYIVGIYILHGLAFLLNTGTGSFIGLPWAIGIISYLFLGFTAALPMLLLRNTLNRYVIVWLVLATTLVPLPTMDYAVIGNMANVKFVFVYIATLLAIYRYNLPSNSRKNVLTDVLLTICILTNVISVTALALPLYRHGREIIRTRNWAAAKNLSYIGMTVMLSVTLLVLTIARDESVSIGNLYDYPYVFRNTIEIFLGRSVLFGFLYPVYTHLTNAITIILTTLLFIGCFLAAARRHKSIVLFTSFMIMITTMILMFSRPGISTLFDDYKSGGYDQYFFAQNIMAFLLFALFLASVARYKRLLVAAGSVALGGLLILAVAAPHTVGRSHFMAITRESFESNAKVVCDNNELKDPLIVTTYPKEPYVIRMNRADICNDKNDDPAKNPPGYSVGLPADGLVFKPGASDVFTQTFVAKSNNLSGISVLLATYEKALVDHYRFRLMDSSCSKTLYTVPLRTMLAADDSYYPIKFDPIKNSSGMQYCFTIETTPSPDLQAFALRTTADHVYDQGVLTVNGGSSNKDVVFLHLYDE